MISKPGTKAYEIEKTILAMPEEMRPKAVQFVEDILKLPKEDFDLLDRYTYCLDAIDAGCVDESAKERVSEILAVIDSQLYGKKWLIAAVAELEVLTGINASGVA